VLYCLMCPLQSRAGARRFCAGVCVCACVRVCVCACVVCVCVDRAVVGSLTFASFTYLSACLVVLLCAIFLQDAFP